jgi:hypothetical protein
MLSSRRVLAITVLSGILLAGCSGSNGPSADAFTMTGSWEQGGQLQDQVTGDTHYHLGTFNFTQIGNQFSGTGQQSGLCHTASNATYQGPLSAPAPFVVVNGRVSGTSVSFDRDICHYTGAFASGNPNKIDGQATCSYTRLGTTYTFTGTWGAARQLQ